MMEEKIYWLGPSSWDQRILSLAPYAEKFKDPAREHDIGYSFGGGIVNKVYIDVYFLKSMIKESGVNPFDYVFALLYFLLVIIFGCFFFNWRKTNV